MIALTYQRKDGTWTNLFRDEAAVLVRDGSLESEDAAGKRRPAFSWLAGTAQTELSAVLREPQLVAPAGEELVLTGRRSESRRRGPLRLRSRRKQYGGLVASEIYELVGWGGEVIASSHGDGWQVDGRWSDTVTITAAPRELRLPPIAAPGKRQRLSPLAQRR